MTSGHYAPINGLNMYYEIHGEGQPLVLLHGNFSAIGTSFGQMIPELAKTRQIVAIDQQGHGRTADIDRPLSPAQMAKDTIALLDYLGLKQVDIFGYSNGSVVALQIAIEHPVLVRKLVLMAITYNTTGLHEGLLEGIKQLQPEHLAGSKWQEEYARVAPQPENWPLLVEKTKTMDENLPDWSAETIQALKSPALIIGGDNDIIRPEHTIEMFKLLGGAVMRMDGSLSQSQLAILPGTSHEMLVDRPEWLVSMATYFLNVPVKA
ncbi:MAG: alpha/beta hydrolase [Anaerolineae bacterium]|nr:alpha/beta hydrolase [Anaerolineae bacterium]